jgi:translation elongation factor P/translation initiation factor 5A
MVYISDFKITNKSLVRYYLTGDKESVQVDDFVKSTEAERKARKARADKLRNLRNKEQREKTFKVTKAGKVSKVVPDEIKPDIHSAWMFNPIC